MGGAVSRFDETDWQQADGGMQKDDAPSSSNGQPPFDASTLDGRPPTTAYDTFSLLKHSVLAQNRCLDVIDSHSNLLYEIRPTPHTLTAFDVYDGATQRHLLRITTDLARRYWMVCRVGIPAYEGQVEEKLMIPNEEDEATGDTESSLAGDSNEEKKQYFKVACVTVSWSRYMSVAAYYGEPTKEQISNYLQQQEELLLEQQAILNRNSSTESSCNSNDDDELHSTDTATKAAMSVDGKDHLSSDQERSIEVKLTDRTDQTSSPGGKVDLSLALTDESSPRSEPGNYRGDSGLEQTGSEEHTLQSSNSMPELQNFTNWLQKTSRGIQQQAIVAKGQIYNSGKDYLHKRRLLQKATSLQDPRKGVIHLDKPLLLCQEIYNKFIGNHQTSRVSKQEVLKLLRQDMEQHLQEQDDSSACNQATRLDDLSETIQKEELESNDDPMVHAVAEESSTTPSDSPQDDQQPPLVGYWHWENTLRTHKMKMHVAKGTDLALHVVMAVLVNQVRYERNAIAMTV